RAREPKGRGESGKVGKGAKKNVLRVLGGLCVLAVGVLSNNCGGGGFFRQYEYEEEMYLSLDGTATMYVNSSVAALNALRGTSFDTNPTAPVDRDPVRAYYTPADTHVTWVRTSRRNGRRFVHVRLDVDDVRRLTESTPFAWSSYAFARRDNEFVYAQTVGRPSGTAGSTNWNGRELVAFR